MNKTLIVRYGEIYLKGKNKSYFESSLVHNIKIALYGINYSILRAQNRIVIEKYSEKDEPKIMDILKRVFGIHSVSPALEIKTDFDEIIKNSVLLSNDTGTFRVTVKRADKKFPYSSMELAKAVGGAILDEKPNLKVDLHNPQHELFIDIRENGLTYIFYDKIICAGGMPIGTAGKGMVLLSGGIDSPVAAYMIAKRGLSLTALHFHSFPYTSEQAKEKVIDLAKILSSYCGKFNLLVVPFTEIQRKIHENCPAEYMITIMRRFMMRIAEKLCETYSCKTIVTGESLGQVASQTLESITVTNSAVENIPVFRPLIAFDKEEIIEISKKINTFNTSILPYEDCCTVFLPKFPIIKPKLALIEKAEESLNVNELIDSALAQTEVIEIKP